MTAARRWKRKGGSRGDSYETPITPVIDRRAGCRFISLSDYAVPSTVHRMHRPPTRPPPLSPVTFPATRPFRAIYQPRPARRTAAPLALPLPLPLPLSRRPSLAALHLPRTHTVPYRCSFAISTSFLRIAIAPGKHDKRATLSGTGAYRSALFFQATQPFSQESTRSRATRARKIQALSQSRAPVGCSSPRFPCFRRELSSSLFRGLAREGFPVSLTFVSLFFILWYVRGTFVYFPHRKFSLLYSTILP